MKKIISYSLFAHFSVFALQAQDTQPVVEGNTKFAFELYQQLDKKGKNIFLSPYSISSALAMTYAGSKTVTCAEMEKVMHFVHGAEGHKMFGELIKEINSRNGKDVNLSVANRLFGDKRYKFLDSYMNTVKNKYAAPLEEVDFVKKLEEARKRINAWVEDETKNKIKELIQPKVLDDSTKLVLVNAIYFYGDWAHQFDSAYTRKGDFYTNGITKSPAKMMWQKQYFSYMENDKMQAIRMPYKGNTLSMEIFLPKQKDGLDQLEPDFTAANYEKWSSSFTNNTVIVTMPKFKMTTDFQLADVLKNMGMKNAFSDAADFSGMTGAPDLKIDKVIHKAFIDVSEKGTEAAAATAVTVTRTTSSHNSEPPPKIFTADHPFFFIIRDNKTGSILFMGRLNEI